KKLGDVDGQIISQLLPQFAVAANLVGQRAQRRHALATGETPQAPQHLSFFIETQVQAGHVFQRPLQVEIVHSGLFVFSLFIDVKRLQQGGPLMCAGAFPPGALHQRRTETQSMSASAMPVSGRTSSARPISATARGMPYTTLDCSSWASTLPPARFSLRAPR